MAEAEPGARASKLPYVCRGEVDYPHSSHTKNCTINVPFDAACKGVAPNLSTEGSLSRSRWYGWEHLKTVKGAKKGTRKLRVVAPKGCKVSGPQGKGSAHVYHQNDREITCKKR